MPFYENVFIARQDVSAAQVEALTEGFANLVAEHGGQVMKREYWGLRNLAYRIKKNRKGHYVLFNLDATRAEVNELVRNMRSNEDVIRYLTVRVETLEEGPSVIMQNRGRGDERDRERGRRGYGDREREREREREEAPRGAEGGEA